MSGSLGYGVSRDALATHHPAVLVPCGGSSLPPRPPRSLCHRAGGSAGAPGFPHGPPGACAIVLGDPRVRQAPPTAPQEPVPSCWGIRGGARLPPRPPKSACAIVLGDPRVRQAPPTAPQERLCHCQGSRWMHPTGLALWG